VRDLIVQFVGPKVPKIGQLSGKHTYCFLSCHDFQTHWFWR